MTIPGQSSPLHHPAPREPLKRLSRSPKRVRSTPPVPTSQSPSPTRSISSSTRSRTTSARPSIAGKRGISYDKETRHHPKTSPWYPQSRDGPDWGLSRRREMSVPLLSQSLSTFTLSQSSSTFGLFPTDTNGCEITPPAFGGRASFALPVEVTPSTKLASLTPRRTPGHDLRSSCFGELPTDHIHPSTAPLPQLPTFLGSPFSTKTARGGYRFKSLSPSKGVMTEHIGQEGFEHINLDWLGKTEWISDHVEGRDDAQDEAPPTRSSKLRRDHSSTSSIDDFCDSGTSSSSLTSLGRSSGEHARPHLVSIWGETETVQLEDDEEDPATPSRQLFSHSSALGALQMEVRDKVSPSASPLVGKSRSRQRSPLQVFFMQTPGGPGPAAPSPPSQDPSPTLPASTSKSAKSFNSLLPRLVSARKPSNSGNPVSCSWSPRTAQRSGVQSSGSTSAPPSRLPMSKSQKSLFKAPNTSALSEIRPSRPPAWTPSAHLGDESDPESSPSKAADTLRDSVSSSTTDGTETTSSTDSPIEPARAALVARRKTLASQPSTKVRSTGTVKPIRPSLRRGVTDPKGDTTTTVFSPEKTFSTPVSALFGDEKPSPAAFASTGLVKKKSGTPGLEIPRFGDSEPPTRIAGLPRGGQPVKSRLGIMIASSPAHRHALSNVSTNENSPMPSSTVSATKTDKTDGSSSTDASVSVYVRGVQQTRGLRRKTSSMFGPSTSSGSIVDGSGAANSPATPTKGMFSVPGLGITTPSPIAGQQNVYPFASSAAPQPPSSAVSRHSTAEMTSPTDTIGPAGFANRLTRTIKRPVARASNPMLAETFKLDGLTHTKKPSTASPSEALKVGGSRLDHDFSLVGSLGKGEFSQVWKVMEKATGSMYAVKAGRPYTGYKSRLRQLEEVSILRQLSLTPHSHVLNFIDSWEHCNRLFIRTELASCGDFATFLLSIADQGAMDESRLWKTLFELASGLQHIHNNNFVHLDLKPSNILITASGALKIGDFGMSLLISSDGDVGGMSPALPKAGTDGDFLWTKDELSVPVPSPILDREVEGDREYLCPEALSEKTVGTAADMFSLGILLLEAALNVVLPSNGDGWVKLRKDDFSDTLEHYLPRQSSHSGHHLSPGSTKPELPIISEPFMDVIQHLMRSQPGERWSLNDVSGIGPVKRMASIEKGIMDGDSPGHRQMSPALVEEGAWFLPFVLGETE